jgi:hypothetical protein
MRKIECGAKNTTRRHVYTVGVQAGIDEPIGEEYESIS